MSTLRQSENFQHEAEHTKPTRMPVAGYMLILFIAAFLLLLLAFFQQQRANSDTIEGLQESVSAMTSVQDLMAERDELLERNDALKEQLNIAAKQAQADQDAIMAAQNQVDALNKLNRLQALQEDNRKQDAQTLLEQWENAQPGVLEQRLAAITSALPPDALEDFDPLESFREIEDWLK